VQSEGDLGDFWADWKDVYSYIDDGQLCFSDMELHQVGAVEEQGKGVKWDPVTTIEVARAEESWVQVLLEESDQLRGGFPQGEICIFKVEIP